MPSTPRGHRLAILVDIDSRLRASLDGWECLVVDAIPEAKAAAGRLVCVSDSSQAELLESLPTLVESGALVVLIHSHLEATTLAHLFRLGLFDALDLDLDPDTTWTQVLDRADKQLASHHAGQSLQAEHSLAQQLLKDGQRRVRHEAAAETAALLQAQADLEAANLRLNDHMAQVSLLYKFGRELSQAENWDDTLRDILANLAEYLGAAGGALVLRAAPGGPYAPRQTYRWQEKSWDKVLLRITRQIDTGVAGSLLAPGIFNVGHGQEDSSERITALPLEHKGVRLGMLLLLFAEPEDRQALLDAHLAFLQMVQVVLSEEVAAAQMLDRLRDISAFNTSVLETVSSAIWVCDSSARTIFVNRAARSMLGLETGDTLPDPSIEFAVGRGRLLDRPLTGSAELDDLPEVFLDAKLSLTDVSGPAFSRLHHAEDTFRGEGHILNRQGRSIPVKVQTAPMAGRGRDDHWLLLILEDLTETRRAEAARRRAEQAESLVAMSATLAHEIRNPLMGLSAQAELLADSLPEEDKRRDRIDLITGEVERINRTITDMLQFVRPCEPRQEVVMLPSLARDCLELARPRADQQDVDLVLDSPPALEITADGTQVKQVILNLLLNAADAAADLGTVTLRLRELSSLPAGLGSQGGVELCVEDDGPGFGDRDPEQLFKPFFTTKTTGTGLGLAYSRKVIEAHGGLILAERTDAVTRMRVLLPREHAAGKTLAGEAS